MIAEDAAREDRSHHQGKIEAEDGGGRNRDREHDGERAPGRPGGERDHRRHKEQDSRNEPRGHGGLGDSRQIDPRPQVARHRRNGEGNQQDGDHRHHPARALQHEIHRLRYAEDALEDAQERRGDHRRQDGPEDGRASAAGEQIPLPGDPEPDEDHDEQDAERHDHVAGPIGHSRPRRKREDFRGNERAGALPDDLPRFARPPFGARHGSEVPSRQAEEESQAQSGQRVEVEGDARDEHRDSAFDAESPQNRDDQGPPPVHRQQDADRRRGRIGQVGQLLAGQPEAVEERPRHRAAHQAGDARLDEDAKPEQQGKRLGAAGARDQSPGGHPLHESGDPAGEPDERQHAADQGAEQQDGRVARERVGDPRHRAGKRGEDVSAPEHQLAEQDAGKQGEHRLAGRQGDQDREDRGKDAEKAGVFQGRGPCGGSVSSHSRGVVRTGR